MRTIRAGRWRERSRIASRPQLLSQLRAHFFWHPQQPGKGIPKETTSTRHATRGHTTRARHLRRLLCATTSLVAPLVAHGRAVRPPATRSRITRRATYPNTKKAPASGGGFQHPLERKAVN